MTFKKIYQLIAILLILSEQAFANYNLPLDTTQIIGRKKAKNIILMIGDGMGIAQIYSGITANGSLNLEKFKYIGFSKTYSTDNYVTDSGAGGTAISTGYKTKNGAIAVDTLGNNLKTILEIAEEHKMYTGLVSTSSITHATPASFIAHNISRNNYQQIAEDFLKTDIEVFIGGGKQDFINREDKKDLIKELVKKEYQITDTITDLKNITKGKLAGFTAKGHNPSIINGRGNMLPIATEKAIELLEQGPNGFFLMVEGSQIDWGGHDNDTKYIVTEMLDFDKAIGVALDFAEKDGNTLLIITADHETGGMAINSGNFKTGQVDAAYSTHGHTGVMVPVFAYGPGAENFMGIYQNTGIFYKMLESLKINQKN